MDIDVRAFRKLRESAAGAGGVRAAGQRGVRVGHGPRRACAWSATGSSTGTTSVTRPWSGRSSRRPAAARPSRAVERLRARRGPAPLRAAGHRRGGGGDARRWATRRRPALARAVGARLGELRLAVQRAVLAGARRLGEGHGQGVRAGRCPAGESAARNTAAARDVILGLFKIWDELAARRALPEELYVIELGVGNGGQARTWLDEFTELDRRHGRDYYRRLHYLIGDYSAHVLDRARQEVAHHGDHVSGLVLEATRPSGSVGFLGGKAFLVYISNVYDNLPTDEVATIRRPRLPGRRPAPISARPPRSGSPREFGLRVAELARAHRPAAANRAGAAGGVAAREVRRPRAGGAVLAGGVGGAAPGRALRPARGPGHLPGDADADRGDPAPAARRRGRRPDARQQRGAEQLRRHAAAAAPVRPGRLPRPVPDRPGQYRAGFYGPGKYDGSVVNWVNGPLLALLANRRGFEVRFSDFKQRPAHDQHAHRPGQGLRR